MILWWCTCSLTWLTHHYYMKKQIWKKGWLELIDDYLQILECPDDTKFYCHKCTLIFNDFLNYFVIQRHGDCSEQFYKDCFMEVLQNQDKIEWVRACKIIPAGDFSSFICSSFSPKERRQIVEMLKRLEDNDSEDIFSTDDHKKEDLEERMAGIDLGTVYIYIYISWFTK